MFFPVFAILSVSYQGLNFSLQAIGFFWGGSLELDSVSESEYSQTLDSKGKILELASVSLIKLIAIIYVLGSLWWTRTRDYSVSWLLKYDVTLISDYTTDKSADSLLSALES